MKILVKKKLSKSISTFEFSVPFVQSLTKFDNNSAIRFITIFYVLSHFEVMFLSDNQRRKHV